MALQAAQTNYDAIKAAYDAYQSSPPYKTNMVYINLVGRVDSLKNALNGYAAGSRSTAAYPSTYNDRDQAGVARAALQTQLTLDRQNNYNLANQTAVSLRAAEQDLSNLIAQSDAWQQNRMNHAAENLSTAQTELDNATNSITKLTAELNP